MTECIINKYKNVQKKRLVLIIWTNYLVAIGAQGLDLAKLNEIILYWFCKYYYLLFLETTNYSGAPFFNKVLIL